MSNLVGGWNLVPMEACNLPQNVATGFTQVFESLVGATYIPVLYCARQVVNGVNHMLICKQTLMTQGQDEHLVKVILNEKPSMEHTGFTIISIENIM